GKLIIRGIEETSVQKTVGSKFRQINAAGCVKTREIAANKNVITVINSHGVNRAIRTEPFHEAEVRNSIRSKADHRISRNTIENIESAAYQNLPVGLESQRIDPSVRARAGAKGSIQTA